MALPNVTGGVGKGAEALDQEQKELANEIRRSRELMKRKNDAAERKQGGTVSDFASALWSFETPQPDPLGGAFSKEALAADNRAAAIAQMEQKHRDDLAAFNVPSTISWPLDVRPDPLGGAFSPESMKAAAKADNAEIFAYQQEGLEIQRQIDAGTGQRARFSEQDRRQAVAAADAESQKEADAAAEEAGKSLKDLVPAIAATAVAFRTVESVMRTMNDLQTGGAMTQAQARKRLGGAMAEAGFKKGEIEAQQAAMASGEIGQLEQSEFVKLFEAGVEGMGGIATDVGRKNILDTIGLAKTGKLPASKAAAVLSADQFGVSLRTKRFGATGNIGATAFEAQAFLAEQDRERVSSEDRAYEEGQSKKRLKTELETQARESLLGAAAQAIGFNEIAVGLSSGISKQSGGSTLWNPLTAGATGAGGALGASLLQKQVEILEEQARIMREEANRTRNTPKSTEGLQ